MNYPKPDSWEWEEREHLREQIDRSVVAINGLLHSLRGQRLCAVFYYGFDHPTLRPDNAWKKWEKAEIAQGVEVPGSTFYIVTEQDLYLFNIGYSEPTPGLEIERGSDAVLNHLHPFIRPVDVSKRAFWKDRIGQEITDVLLYTHWKPSAEPNGWWVLCIRDFRLTFSDGTICFLSGIAPPGAEALDGYDFEHIYLYPDLDAARQWGIGPFHETPQVPEEVLHPPTRDEWFRHEEARNWQALVGQTLRNVRYVRQRGGDGRELPQVDWWWISHNFHRLGVGLLLDTDTETFFIQEDVGLTCIPARDAHLSKRDETDDISAYTDWAPFLHQKITAVRTYRITGRYQGMFTDNPEEGDWTHYVELDFENGQRLWMTALDLGKFRVPREPGTWPWHHMTLSLVFHERYARVFNLGCFDSTLQA